MPPDAAPPPRLRAAQRAMARALHAPELPADAREIFDGPAAIAIADRLNVYRNNGRQFFRTTLALTYPVVQHRVGEEFFRQLGTEYRGAHPSRSGDLHWVGAEFPGWLHSRLQDTEYSWLADLARLEWACEEAGAAATLASLPLQRLAAVPPEHLDDARLRLQPSVRLVASDWPVWSVWQANQAGSGSPVDLTTGPEHCVCVATAAAGVAVFRVDAEAYALLGELVQAATLAEAVARSGTTPDVLARVLQWAFAEGLVVDVSPSAPA